MGTPVGTPVHGRKPIGAWTNSSDSSVSASPLSAQLQGAFGSHRQFSVGSGDTQTARAPAAPDEYIQVLSDGACSAAGRALLNGSERAAAEVRLLHASQEAHTSSLGIIQPALDSREDKPDPVEASRVIERAEARVLAAVFRHAPDPAVADDIYAKGDFAARVGVADVAIALSVLRQREGDPDICDKFEKKLCKLMLADGLQQKSGFSSWRPDNCHDAVNELIKKINVELDNLPDKSDIFEGTMRDLVMPELRRGLESRFGYLSYGTWQKIDAARGLISRAAAQAADNMADSLRAWERGKPSDVLHAKTNRWRVAHLWPEMMRATQFVPIQSEEQPQGREAQSPASTIHDQFQSGPPAVGSATTSTWDGIEDANVSQTARTAAENDIVSLAENMDEATLRSLLRAMPFDEVLDFLNGLLNESRDERNQLGSGIDTSRNSPDSTTSDLASNFQPEELRARLANLTGLADRSQRPPFSRRVSGEQISLSENEYNPPFIQGEQFSPTLPDAKNRVVPSPPVIESGRSFEEMNAPRASQSSETSSLNGSGPASGKPITPRRFTTQESSSYGSDSHVPLSTSSRPTSGRSAL